MIGRAQHRTLQPVVSSGASAPADALWRAMGITRLLDCGMDYADVQALSRLTNEGAAWDEAAEALGFAQLERGRVAEAADHRVTAAEAYRASAACFLFAQMAYNFDVPRKIDLYRRFDDAVEAASRLHSGIFERVELPFEAGTMYGWLVAPVGPIIGTVVLFGGQSGWGAAYLRHAHALNLRGIATLLAEGPGQGTTRLRGQLYLNVDIREAYSVFVDHVLAQPNLGGKVALWGNSMGGLYAATTAASDGRIAAICVNGAPARPRLLSFRTFQEQAFAMYGSDQPDAVQANLDSIAFGPDDRISCPLLVLHGGEDPIVSLEEQQPFLDAAANASLRVWDDGEHTIYNHSAERTAYVADWFVEQFRSQTGRS